VCLQLLVSYGAAAAAATAATAAATAATSTTATAADQARLSASHATANNLELLIKMLLLQHRQRCGCNSATVQDLYHNLFINFIK